MDLAKHQMRASAINHSLDRSMSENGKHLSGDHTHQVSRRPAKRTCTFRICRQSCSVPMTSKTVAGCPTTTTRPPPAPSGDTVSDRNSFELGFARQPLVCRKGRASVAGVVSHSVVSQSDPGCSPYHGRPLSPCDGLE